MTYGVQKINGTVFADQSLTGGLNYFTVRTTLDITADGVVSDANQTRLDKLVETISTRAQPVIIGAVTTTSEAAPVADLPVSASQAGSVTVYNFRFAIEHNLAWDAEALAEAFNGLLDFVYTTPTTNNNISVTMYTNL